MRDQLLGYLLGALEPDERLELENQLRHDRTMQRELELVNDSLDPLRAAQSEFQPPPGLALETCQRVSEHRAAASGPTPSATHQPAPYASPSPASESAPGLSYVSSWRLGDFAVAAGIVLAASLMLFPAILHSRTSARVVACQNNLRDLAIALVTYSTLHNDHFPVIEDQGNLSTAGVYAVRLLHGGFIDGTQTIICPASSLADHPESVYVPHPDELRGANGALLQGWLERMGGSYGYTMGYMDGKRYQSPKNQSRSSYAVMSDRPSRRLDGHKSENHRGCGQNVLYEDGHVKYLTQCRAEGCRDHIFLNDQGRMQAGLHINDAVIGRSSSRPQIETILRQD